MIETEVKNVPNENFLSIKFSNPSNSSFWYEPLEEGDSYQMFITRTTNNPNITFSVIYFGYNDYYDGQSIKANEPFASRPLYEDKVYTAVASPMLVRQVTSLWYINNPDYKSTLHMNLEDPYEEETNVALKKDPTLKTTNTIGVIFLNSYPLRASTVITAIPESYFTAVSKLGGYMSFFSLLSMALRFMH